MGKIINLSSKRNLHLSLVFQFSKYHLIFIPFLALLLLTAWLRPVWYDDAGHYLVIEQGVAEGTFCHPTDIENGVCDWQSPFITLGAPLNIYYASWLKVFGGEMGSARLATIIFSLIGFWALFNLVRRSFSIEKAFWTALLLIGNIQLLSYGSQVLGEMPMMAGVLCGLNFILRWRQSGKWQWWLLAIPALLWAVFCKAYIALPIGFGLGMWILISLFKRDGKAMATLGLAMLWGLGVIAAMVVEQGGWSEFQVFLQNRGSYANEFFTFDFVEALRFLIFKPLFSLGSLALLIRIYFQRRDDDILLACFQLSLLVFFLCSAGYDRFGFLLLFIPAIYLSEFCLSLWNRWKGKRALQVVFGIVFAILFVQQTPLILARDWPGRMANEKAWLEKWVEAEPGGLNSVFTYDQHYALLCQKLFRLPVVVPSNKQNCEPLVLRAGEFLVAGPYAFTEYQNCIPWDTLEEIGKIEDENYPVTFYRNRK